MQLCGFVGCPKDACEEVKEQADYVSTVKGEHGAVRDIIEYLLKIRKEWRKAILNAYRIGA